MMHPLKPASFFLQRSVSPQAKRVAFGQAGFQQPKTALSPLHQDTVHFSGTSLKGFRQEDINTIRDMMKPYRYGKDLERMLRPETRVQALFYRDRVIIRNYDYLDLSQQARPMGVCHELAWDLVKKLRARFGDRYHFAQVYGQAATYFNDSNSTHIFILAWQPKHDQQVREALERNPGKIPLHTLIFDPSFNLAADDEGLQMYKPQEISNEFEIDIARPEIEEFMFFSPFNKAKTDFVPLGFLSDLEDMPKPPPLSKPMMFLEKLRHLIIRPPNPSESLISLGFKKNEITGEPDIVLYRKNGPKSDDIVWDNWRKMLNPQSLLMRFMTKLEQDLKYPDAELVALLDKKLPADLSNAPDVFTITVELSSRFALA